jgi:hypothetical protein
MTPSRGFSTRIHPNRRCSRLKACGRARAPLVVSAKTILIPHLNDRRQLPCRKTTAAWLANWVEAGPLSPGGGQGRILFVTRAYTTEGSERFALKILRAPNPNTVQRSITTVS